MDYLYEYLLGNYIIGKRWKGIRHLPHYFAKEINQVCILRFML